MIAESAENSLNVKLYCKEGGQDGGGSWLELSNARVVEFAATTDIVEIDSTFAPRENVPVRKNATITFEMVCETDDAGFTAIKNAWLDGGPIGIKCLAKENGEGLQADWVVTKFTRTGSQPGRVKVVKATIHSTRRLPFAYPREITFGEYEDMAGWIENVQRELINNA